MLRFGALSAIVIALARPQWVSKFTEVNSSGVDIMLAIDVSGSMMGLDFSDREKTITRLDIAKEVTKVFIENRPNDRLGMCAFAGEPYLVSPLTLNHTWLKDNLRRLHVKLIEDGTAIGDTICMCANRLKNSQAKSKIIVLVTDGDNNCGTLSPVVAAEAAAALGIKIYTIGVGKSGLVPFAVTDEQGHIQTDYDGKYIAVQYMTELDEAPLRAIAEQTQGQFFRAENREEFSQIYETIDQLEKTDVKLQQYAIVDEWFPWLVAVAMLLLLLEFLLRATKLQRIP
ncbi:MAG: VWA domain-containing protein [Verrucomicrobiota bacterium]|nr:MAG: VWA domain-containing protein [Verrucomicrobiota bacterium]